MRIRKMDSIDVKTGEVSRRKNMKVGISLQRVCVKVLIG